MTRILITGASGFLGHNLAAGLCAQHEIFEAYFENPPDPGRGTPVQFDITDAAAVLSRVEQIRPQLVVHSAAVSQPDECERRPERALDVLVAGTRNVAEACGRISARLVHISTDLVFDGKRGNYVEEDAVHGISVYARAKIQAERVVSAASPAYVILRIALLFGIGGRSHPGSLAATVRSWREGRPQTFFTDQFRTPVFAPQVAEIIDRVLQHPEASGVFHAGGADRLSRYEFALSLAQRVGAPAGLVRPGSMLDSPAVALRGADCSLVSERIRRTLGIRLLGSTEALDLMRREGFLDSL